jgi:outer membrane protein assembly factor BamB
MVSAETEWFAQGREAPLWSAALGRGYSSVSVAAGRLFTLGHDEAAGLDRVYCFDALTGVETWRHEWPADIRDDSHGGGTLTTPSILGERVYVTNREGRGFCFEAEDGELVWQHDYREELGLELPGWGFSASPLLIDGRLVLELGGALVFCDPASGDVLSVAGNAGWGAYANPAPFELDGRPLLAVFAGTGLVVHDRSDGEVVWTHRWRSSPGVNVGTPVVIGDSVLVSAGYGLGAVRVRLATGAEPEVLWTNRMMRNKVSGLVAFEEHLYGFDESMLKCYGLDGLEKWRVRGLGIGVPSIAGGRLLVLSSKGELIVAPATPEGFEALSRRKVLDGGVYWTPPVLVGGLIYCRSSLGDLVCLDHRSGPEGAGVSTAPGAELSGALPEPSALFERHAELVGASALRTRASLHLEGRIEIPGDGRLDGTLRIDRMPPNKGRLEFMRDATERVVRCFDGEAGWELDDFLGNSVVEGRALQELRETMSFFHGVDWSDAYTQLETRGRASFGGRDCWVVVGRTPLGTERRIFFDAESGHRVGRSADEEGEVVHAEWREFEGVQLPTRTTVMVATTGQEETYYITAATWDQVDPLLFERPPEVVRMLLTPEQMAAIEADYRERFGAFLGSYRADFPPYKGKDWTFVVEEGQLRIRTGKKRFMVLAEPDDQGRFALERGKAVSFVVDESGRAHTLRYHTPQKDMDLPRTDP